MIIQHPREHKEIDNKNIYLIDDDMLSIQKGIKSLDRDSSYIIEDIDLKPQNIIENKKYLPPTLQNFNFNFFDSQTVFDRIPLLKNKIQMGDINDDNFIIKSSHHFEGKSLLEYLTELYPSKNISLDCSLFRQIFVILLSTKVNSPLTWLLSM